MAVTTRLGMNKPANTDVVDVQTALSAQYTQLDNDAIIQVCTSGTRPSSPYTGKLIYETDTGFVMRYSGATWTIVNNRDFPRGRNIGNFVSSTATSATVAANGSTLTLTRTMDVYAGRRYGVSAGGGVDMVAGNDASNYVQLRWIAGASITATTGTAFCAQAADCNENTTGAIMRWQMYGYLTPGITGQITIGVVFGRPNNADAKTCNVREYQWLAIEDLRTG